MQTPKFKSPTSIVIGPCRLSYVHLIRPWAREQDEEQTYSCAVLIPKGDEGKETIEAVRKAIDAAKAKGKDGVYNGQVPTYIKNPTLRDGADREKDPMPEFYYFNCKSKRRPLVIDRDGTPITDEETIYSGAWAYVSVDFYPYNAKGNKGVGVGLNAVKKFKDDERFGATASASDFDGFDDNEDDL